MKIFILRINSNVLGDKIRNIVDMLCHVAMMMFSNQRISNGDNSVFQFIHKWWKAYHITDWIICTLQLFELETSVNWKAFQEMKRLLCIHEYVSKVRKNGGTNFLSLAMCGTGTIRIRHLNNIVCFHYFALLITRFSLLGWHFFFSILNRTTKKILVITSRCVFGVILTRSRVINIQQIDNTSIILYKTSFQNLNNSVDYWIIPEEWNSRRHPIILRYLKKKPYVILLEKLSVYSLLNSPISVSKPALRHQTVMKNTNLWEIRVYWTKLNISHSTCCNIGIGFH